MDKPKRLYRSTTNRIIAGVCGGLGEYFNVDPLIFRILFVVLGIWGGSGIILYIIMWLITPEAGKESMPVEKRVASAGQEIKEKAQKLAGEVRSSNRATPAVIFGIILLVIGISALLQAIVPWRLFRWDIVWPLVIIAFGLVIMLGRK